MKKTHADADADADADAGRQGFLFWAGGRGRLAGSRLWVGVGDGRHDDDDGDDDGSVFHQELTRRSYSSSIIGMLLICRP